MDELRRLIELLRKDPIEFQLAITTLLGSGGCVRDDISQLAAALNQSPTQPGATQANSPQKRPHPERVSPRGGSKGNGGPLSVPQGKPSRRSALQERGPRGNAAQKDITRGTAAEVAAPEKSNRRESTNLISLVTSLQPDEETAGRLKAIAADHELIFQTAGLSLGPSESTLTFNEVYQAAKRISNTQACNEILFRFVCVSICDAAIASHYHDGEKFLKGGAAALSNQQTVDDAKRTRNILEKYVQKGVRYKRYARRLHGYGALLILPRNVADDQYLKLNNDGFEEVVTHFENLDIQSFIDKFETNKTADFVRQRLKTELPFFENKYQRHKKRKYQETQLETPISVDLATAGLGKERTQMPNLPSSRILDEMSRQQQGPLTTPGRLADSERLTDYASIWEEEPGLLPDRLTDYASIWEELPGPLPDRLTDYASLWQEDPEPDDHGSSWFEAGHAETTLNPCDYIDTMGGSDIPLLSQQDTAPSHYADLSTQDKSAISGSMLELIVHHLREPQQPFDNGTRAVMVQ